MEVLGRNRSALFGSFLSSANLPKELLGFELFYSHFQTAPSAENVLVRGCQQDVLRS